VPSSLILYYKHIYHHHDDRKSDATILSVTQSTITLLEVSFALLKVSADE